MKETEGERERERERVREPLRFIPARARNDKEVPVSPSRKNRLGEETFRPFLGQQNGMETPKKGPSATKKWEQFEPLGIIEVYTASPT